MMNSAPSGSRDVSRPNPNSAGSRRWQRDLDRQRNFVMEKDWQRQPDWNAQEVIETGFQNRQQQQNPGRQQRNRRRAAAWKKATVTPSQVAPQPAPRDLSQFKSTQDVGARDEPLYDLVAGSRPVRNIYSQNLDFSGFPLLCEVVYRELKQTNPRIKREMPFCAFLHAMTSCINAWLFRTVTDLNCEDRYADERDAMSLIPLEMLIPQPIAEYLAMINTVVTPSGDTIRVNIPDQALPQHGIDALPPGSFGHVTAETHNAYECYVSPLVTRNYLVASREGVRAYQPLPDGSFPAGSVPNGNLLGFYPPEALTPEGRAALGTYDFPESDDMAGRLQVVPALLQEVSNTLSRCSRDFKIVKFHDTQRRPVQTGLIFSKAVAVAGHANTAVLSKTVSNVHGPYAFGNTTATQAVLFALKRERNNHGRGLCYTLDNNAAPAGWTATMNNNFNMVGEFSPLTGVDGPQFRADSHQAFPPDGDKENFIADWLKAFRLQRG